MKVELPYIVQDQLTAEREGMRPVESFHYEGPEQFLDGPVSTRVAVLDFDEHTGELIKPIPFERPAGRRVLARYELGSLDPGDRDFQRVSV